jgi:hypothetical protein
MIDFRYHAMSLAAVFVALALGLLLGVTLGDTNLISNARGSLESSLKSDLKDAHEVSDARKQTIEQQQEFIAAAYPQLVRGDLAGRRVATIGSAKVAQSTLRSVTRAIEPAGAKTAYVAQLLAKPQYKKIASSLGVQRTIDGSTPTTTEANRLGRAVGRRLAQGKNADVMRRLVFSRLSGSFQRAQLFAYARQATPQETAGDEKVYDAFERGVVAGIAQQASRVAGVESTTTSPSNIKWYNSLGLATVDNIQDFSGYYSLVAIFNGAKGDYGTKDTAGSLMPQVGL